jgi:serine/threonine protein phosphatase PrpC
MVRDPKIENVVEQTDEDPSVTGEALIQAALEGGGEDNVSVIVVHMNESFDIADTPRVQLLAKPDSVQMPQLL